MKEPRYVKIFCAGTAEKQSKHTHHHRDFLGMCFAEKIDGRWQCCCCGKKVSVAW
jgi:hypothetical protein